jgi:nucleotide-binding universal stress UspA family protein
MYDDILVPTDGSRGANAGLDHGIEMATQWDATLHVLYVVDTRLARSGPLLEILRDEGTEPSGTPRWPGRRRA